MRMAAMLSLLMFTCLATAYGENTEDPKNPERRMVVGNQGGESHASPDAPMGIHVLTKEELTEAGLRIKPMPWDEPAGNIDESVLLLDQAEKRWEQARLNSYSYTLRNSTVFSTKIYRIIVRNGVCRAKFRDLGEGLQIRDTGVGRWRKISCEDVSTVEDLFYSFRKLLLDKPKIVQVRFDDQYGYPVTFGFEEREKTDTLWMGAIWDFKVVNNRGD